MSATENEVEKYNNAFYAAQANDSRRSADRVLAWLFERIGCPSSVVDIGCGVGAWLAAASALGADEIRGLDGSSAAVDALMIPREAFAERDFTGGFAADRSYQLAMSLEVAEHVPVESHRVFVESLCGHSDLVLFSAAVPYQGGTGHVGENWPAYWAKLFADNGYECFDVLRYPLWNVRGVCWWYKQNLLVFERRNGRRMRTAGFHPSKDVLTLIHPELLLLALHRAGELGKKDYERDIRYYFRLKDGDPSAVNEPIEYGPKYHTDF